MNDAESKFLETEPLQPVIRFIYIDDMFFVWTVGEENLHSFLTDLNNYNLHIKFRYEFNQERISFLYLNLSFCDGKLIRH